MPLRRPAGVEEGGATSSSSSSAEEDEDDGTAEESLPLWPAARSLERRVGLRAPRRAVSVLVGALLLCLAAYVVLHDGKQAASSRGGSWRQDEKELETEASLSAADGSVSLYCFMLIPPVGYERELVRMQHELSLGIFGCDARTVVSNETFPLAPDGESTLAVPGDMHSGSNNWTWARFNVKLALNTGVFLRVWKVLYALGLWRNYDFTLKLEADTVFFPNRLRDVLHARPLAPRDADLEQAARLHGAYQCGNCSKRDMRTDSCVDHVLWEQRNGLTCSEALQRVARQPPHDCGCSCGAAACASPGSVYVRNCGLNFYTPDQSKPIPALHGGLEVLSRLAFFEFGRGLDWCIHQFQNTTDQWGEDWFMEHCLLALGVQPVDAWNVLSAEYCDPYKKNDGSCRAPAVAFQPHKTRREYMECYWNAQGAPWTI
eukprot:TRINITY_DN47_c1_g1_i1.p1 TRINITY_DN47_c1_g1~~TRINITY_DN47_c1_g1_i1.p1  ORF type:complete len:431 (-),score=70.19 TRINITY_DN47_c1_g1_i1:61-1353(-)